MNRILAAILRAAAVGLFSLACCTGNFSPAQTATGPGTLAAQVHESWDICLLQGKRVGYSHTMARRQTESGRRIVHTENTSRLSFNRGGELATIETLVTSDETPQGQVLRFQSETRMGPSPIRVSGQVHGERLDLEILGPAATTPKPSSLAWSADYRGPFAVEQGLLREPMRPGQRRTLKMIMPGLDNVEVADVELTAKEFEPTTLRSGPHELLRIDTVTRLAGGQKMEGTLWCDRTGDVLKNLVGPVETFRATKAEALEKADAAGVDLLSNMLLKVDRPLPNAHQTKRVRYRVHLEGGDPAAVFVTGPTQAVKSIDPHTAEITVYAIRPGQPGGNPKAPADPPSDDDRRPGNFIQSDDPLVVADAKKAAGDEKDPWRVAVALERFVHREVTAKDFTQAFASAAEVAKSREGDCTEHAVFLAALARAAASPPASPSAWCTSSRCRLLATTCGRKYTSTSGGFPSTPRSAPAASAPGI